MTGNQHKLRMALLQERATPFLTPGCEDKPRFTLRFKCKAEFGKNITEIQRRCVEIERDLGHVLLREARDKNKSINATV